MLDPMIQGGGGGGGTIGSPVPQNAKKMNLKKSPMDMNKNRNVKLMQVSSQVAENASSDGATNKQCRPAHRQSTKTTVTETYTNFADKPKPTQSQGTVVAAEDAGTDGTTNVQCRSIDYDNMKTTVMKLPTDFVKLPRGFLELAEEARNVSVESGQSCYTVEVQSQGAGLTRPVFVTVMEYSLSVLKEGAMIAECFPRVIPISQGHSFILGPVGPRRMLSQCKPNQPVAVGPVGQSFTPGPVGPCGMVSNCKRKDRIANSPLGSTVTPDPVEQMESPIQIDFMKIVTTDGHTPPSSDSGIHSLGEQWENMSISTADTEAEQTVRPTNCS